MKITITGSEGFIGQHLKQAIGPEYNQEYVDLKLGSDICNLEEVGDIVVHLAAVSFIPDSFKDMEGTMRSNLVGLARVISLCRKQGSKLIFTSSSGVIDPHSPYVYSKLWGEQLIKDSGIDYTILRLGNVYGEGDDKSAIYCFQRDEELTINGSGEIVRNFVYVGDVVNAIKASFSRFSRETINVGHQNMTVNQVAKLFNKPIHYGVGRQGDAFCHAMESDWPSKVRLEQWLAS